MRRDEIYVKEKKITKNTQKIKIKYLRTFIETQTLLDVTGHGTDRTVQQPFGMCDAVCGDERGLSSLYSPRSRYSVVAVHLERVQLCLAFVIFSHPRARACAHTRHSGLLKLRIKNM